MHFSMQERMCVVGKPHECVGVMSHITMHAAVGLDSSNASRVVDILSGLASAGVTVIITIHQPRPDILRLMDRMLLLSDNGQVCPHPSAGGMHMNSQKLSMQHAWSQAEILSL